MATSTINLWGRAWKLSVKTTVDPGAPVTEVLSQDSWDPEALRVTFDVLHTAISSPYSFATITVYNLSDPEMQNLVLNAAWVTLEAGYQYGSNKSSIIWDGPVLQVLYGRPNVVDKTITFNCVATTPELEDNFVNGSYGPLFSQAQAVEQMISDTGGNPSQQISSYASGILNAKKYPRGKTVFGQASKYIGDIARDNFLQYRISPGGKHTISELANPDTPITPAYIYASAPPPGWLAKQATTVSESIIGVPTQSPFGVDFTVLLDPRLYVAVPPMVLGLDYTVITQLQAQYPLPQQYTPLPKDGSFICAQIRHYGDTRGNDWYTDVTGVSRVWALNLLDGSYAASAGGAP